MGNVKNTVRTTAHATHTLLARYPSSAGILKTRVGGRKAGLRRRRRRRAAGTAKEIWAMMTVVFMKALKAVIITLACRNTTCIHMHI